MPSFRDISERGTLTPVLPIQGEEFLNKLREEGEKFEVEERVKNKEVITNVLADSLSAFLLALAITFNRRRVSLLRVHTPTPSLPVHTLDWANPQALLDP